MKPIYKILILAFVVAALLSPLASSNPDGLERVAIDLGFVEKGEGAKLKAPFADYLFPGIDSEAVSKAAAGIAGTIITFAAMYGLARVMKRRKPDTAGGMGSCCGNRENTGDSRQNGESRNEGPVF